MIGDGPFYTQLNKCEEILEDLKLLEERNLTPNQSLGAAHFKGMSYRETYTSCIKYLAYDFKLVDQSLLLFVRGGNDKHNGTLGFCYYECPFRIMTYEEFVGSEFGLKPLDPEFEQYVAETGDELRFEYEQYISTSDSKVIATPVRYDYKDSDYRAGIHPASHVHFGFANHIRVGTKKVMNLVSFTLFIVRQRYPREWEVFLEDVETSVHLCRNVREHLDNIHGDYWGASDDMEVSLI
jgi:hypothetical protein